MRVTGVVRLTADPDLQTVNGGGEERTVCRLRCAMTMTHGREGGFVDVVAWGRQAELCAEYLGKGSTAFVDGQLRQEEWTSGDGQRRESHRVIADDVRFLNPRPSADADEHEHIPF